MLFQSFFAAPKIIVALDVPSIDIAKQYADQFSPQQCRIKIGKELFTRGGPGIVQYFVDKGFSVFLDLKFHDIPVTVAHACQAAADLGVWMINVHALGGAKMLEAAANKLYCLQSNHKPLLIAVTILTSHTLEDIAGIGLAGNAVENVTRLALLAQQAGLDGVVCSAEEASSLRRACGNKFCLVTPGIRLQGIEDDDQTRILTPIQALQAGSDYLVIGRPITQASSPVEVITHIRQQIGEIK